MLKGITEEPTRKVRTNGQETHRKTAGTLMEPDNQSVHSCSEHQTIRLRYWVIQVSGRKATSTHTHQFAHSSPETLNLLMRRRLKCITLSGGKGDWEFNGREFR